MKKLIFILMGVLFVTSAFSQVKRVKASYMLDKTLYVRDIIPFMGVIYDLGSVARPFDVVYTNYVEVGESMNVTEMSITDSIKFYGNILYERHNDVISAIDIRLTQITDTFELAEDLTSGADLYLEDIYVLVDSNSFEAGTNLDYWSTNYDIEVREDVRTVFGLDYSTVLENSDASTSIVGARWLTRANADGDYNTSNTVDKIYGLRAIDWVGIDNSGVLNSSLHIGMENEFRALGNGGIWNLTDFYGQKITLYEGANITENIDNLYGLHISGDLDATNKYGIYEDLGDNYFAHKIIANDAIVQTQLSGSLTDGAPLETELNTVTGLTPVTAGAGYQITVKDSDGTGLLYRVESDGTDWFYLVTTKAL